MNLDTSIIIERVDKLIQLENFEHYVKNFSKITKSLKPNAELIVNKYLITPNQYFEDFVPQPPTTHPTIVTDPVITGVLGPTGIPSS